MTIKAILGAAVVASAPVAVAAATLSADNDIDAGGTYDVAGAPFQWNASFDDGETEAGVFGPDGLQFTFTNDTFGLKTLTLAITTINQFKDDLPATSDYYFTGGITSSLNGDSVTLEEGESGNFVLSTLVDPGDSAVLNFDFGQVVAEGVGPDIDFRVTAAPIPVPAALPLLGAALGGLGLVARRRQKA